MATAVPYIWVPVLAVFFYAFLLIAFFSAKKSKLIYSFMLYILVLLLWTCGSMMMRLQLDPGYQIWYQVSIIAVFALPYAFYDFVYCYLQGNNKNQHTAMLLFTVVILILTYFQAFLDIPVLTKNAAGQDVFVYHSDWRLVFPAIMAVILVGLSFKLIRDSIVVKHKIVTELYPALIGAGLLIVGNIISVLPGNLIPFDTLAGVLNAWLVFYTLTKRRAFKLTLLVSPSVVLYCTLILMLALSSLFVDGMVDIVRHYVTSYDSVITIISIFFTALVLLTGMLAYRAINRITLRREQVVQDQVKNFSIAVSKSLNAKMIMEQLSDVLCTGIGVSHLMIFMYDADSEKYILAHTANPLDKKNIEIDKNVPYVDFIKDSDACLMIDEFKRSITFRSMWEKEKSLLMDSDTACITSLKNNNELIGIMLIGSKDNNSDYTYDDMVFIESIQSIASIALNNALLFEQTQKRADIDALTGIYNRNAFLRYTEEAIIKYRGNQLSLIMISLDDFRLYNELYGSQEGDEALKFIARIIINSISKDDICGRYSGKEFIICLPGKNQMQALKLTENIRSQLRRSGSSDGAMKMKQITFCAGICSIPYGASNLKELLTNVNMQVYSGKRTGKDKIVTYQADNISGEYALDMADAGSPSRHINLGRYEEAAPTIYALTAAIDAKDHYTFKHSRNVATYAMTLARKVGLSRELVQLIYEAGLLHDVGKIAIPERILSKPGRLEGEEYDVMKTHVEHSIEIIRHLPNLDYLIPTVVGHHERWDGMGYPNGLEGKNIPLGARCMAIADCFDAMTSKRSYKEAFSVEYAAKEIVSQAGRQFDPQLAMTFVEMINEGQIWINMAETESDSTTEE
jgi:diguanylate cyclase (GGDEF)-like protein/putative nucleotidyltransferase with HDIG domain